MIHTYFNLLKFGGLRRLFASYFELTLRVWHGYDTQNKVSILHKLYVCDFVSVYRGEILRYVYCVFNALKQENGICSYLFFSCCWWGLFKLLMMLVSFVAVLVDDASLLCCWFWSHLVSLAFVFGLLFIACLLFGISSCSVFLVPCDWVCS